MLRPGSRAIFLGLCGVGLLAGSLAFVGCAELDEVELGVCGNRILEPELGEDCDGSALSFGPEAKCGAPNGSAPCRLTCSPQAASTGCPAGWGCGNDGVCRRPTAELEFGSLPGEARAVGDLDGDGLDDIVMRGPGGEAQVGFFTEGRNLATLFVDPARRPISDEPAVQPIVTRLNGDAIDDLALPTIGDDVAVRVFMGSSSRELANPFVELVTVPFDTGSELSMQTAFNPVGVPQQLCEIGGCTQTLLLHGQSKDADQLTRYAVLVDRELVELFTLAEGRRQQSSALGRFVETLPCDVLAVSYRHTEDGSPGNLAELFPLCTGPGQLNQTVPLGTVAPLSSVSVSDTGTDQSLVISGWGDIDGDQRPDLLLNIIDDDPATDDDPSTYALYGRGDGHFNARADAAGLEDLADRSSPLIRAHSWATSDDPSVHFDFPTWPRAMADINADGRADFVLAAGVIALSTNDPGDTCMLAGETVLAGPPLGDNDEPQWGYACMLVSEHALIDAATASREDVRRNWISSGSLATSLDLQGKGRPAFAAIDKNKFEYTGQPTDHSPIDMLDLIWVDDASAQLVLQTIEAVRIEQVAAGDIDGDFAIDLVTGNGTSLQTIWGPPFDPARATSFSPVGFDVLQVFGEGLPSASLGAERDGRLTIFRDGQWPALALIEPGDCATPEDCHVRFASGALDDERHFAWALGVVRSSEGSGLRLLRAVEGEANLGPAYDSAKAPLVPLSELELSVTAERATVVAIDLDEPASGEASIDEAIVIGHGEDGVELAILRARLDDVGAGELCSQPFVVDPATGDARVLCFELTAVLDLPGQARPHPRSNDLFVEVADADGDGLVDLSWVTFDNHIMLLRNDGSGSFSLDELIELSIPQPHDGQDGEPDEPSEEDEDEPLGPARIDWVRWIELDGTAGRELISSDVLGSGQLWGINVHFDEGLLDPRGAVAIDSGATLSVGHRGDFDGDGIDDIALGRIVMFGQPVND